MNGKLILSFSLATLIVVVGGFVAVLNRLDSPEATETAPEPSGREPLDLPSSPRVVPDAQERNPLQSKDVLVKLDHLIVRFDEMEDGLYETAVETSQEIYDLKMEVRKLKGTLKQIIRGIARAPGGFQGIGWGLAPADLPIDEETKRAYRQDAEKMGLEVEDGRVVVRGFLNLSPNASMPIEYFITRFPEAGHETLVHLIGSKTWEDIQQNPYGSLRGLATALYKALIAAGFEQGNPTRPDPESDPREPAWFLASGDTIYIAVRYQHGGKTHVARATDWVLDPNTGTVLPEDCFRFTGSMRGEDPDTGDDVLRSEMMGLLVSVWPNSAALIEVSLEAALRNDFQYNFSRIPKSENEDLLYLDVIFSKTPVAVEGDGAIPIPPPPEQPVDQDGDGASLR